MKPANYRIKVLEIAARDVQAQFEYIQDRSPTGARLWYEAYLDALERLKFDPTALSLAPESEHVEEDIRQIFFKTRRGYPYRIVYTVVDDEVRVLRVRGLGQEIVSSEGLS